MGIITEEHDLSIRIKEHTIYSEILYGGTIIHDAVRLSERQQILFCNKSRSKVSCGYDGWIWCIWSRPV